MSLYSTALFFIVRLYFNNACETVMLRGSVAINQISRTFLQTLLFTIGVTQEAWDTLSCAIAFAVSIEHSQASPVINNLTTQYNNFPR